MSPEDETELDRFEKGAHKAMICELAAMIAAQFIRTGESTVDDRIAVKSVKLAFDIEAEYDKRISK